MSAQFDLLRPPPDPAPGDTHITARSISRQKARVLQETGARRWILAGKPIALEVARARGEVTAETFRAAAEKLNALPPSYGGQRAYSWIPALFRELCAERLLRKQLHPNGAPVRRYSKAQGNDQVVYSLAGVGK